MVRPATECARNFVQNRGILLAYPLKKFKYHGFGLDCDDQEQIIKSSGKIFLNCDDTFNGVIDERVLY